MSPARAPGGGVSYERARRVLIAGAGVAALEAVLALRDLAGARVSLDVLAPTPDFVLRPFSVLEPFGEARVARLSLGGVLRELGAGHLFDGIAEVEPARHVVRAMSGDEYGYDALIVRTGARAVDALSGALTFPGPGAAARFRELLGELERGEVRELVFAVPDGTGWGLPLYELALLTAAWLFERRVADVRLTVVTPETTALAAFGGRASDTVAELLERHGVELRRVVSPCRRPGRRAAAERRSDLPCRAGGGAGATGVPAWPGLPSDPDGFVPVDAHGRVPGRGGRLCRGRYDLVADEAGRPCGPAGRRGGGVAGGVGGLPGAPDGVSTGAAACCWAGSDRRSCAPTRGRTAAVRSRG